MKIALLSLLVILSCTGCTKTYVTNDPVNQVYSALFTVGANQWTPAIDDLGAAYYFTTLDIPELTQQIDLNGGVVVYLSFDDPASTNPVYEAMPEVINGVAYGVLHSTGSVTIDLREAYGGDLTSGIKAPTLIKVVLLDAQALDN